MTTVSPLVVIQNVTKVYEPMPRAMRLLLRTQIREPVHALAGISLVLERGEVCLVIGPNGAGKSTLFRIVTGLTTPTTGTALVAGVDATEHSSQVRRHIGFAPAEERTLLLRHTCRENLAFHGAMQGMTKPVLEQRIDEVLDFVGLGKAANTSAFALSTGMRARLQLARALLHEPDVLVLDEPTSAIDPVSARAIIRLVLRAARERGAAVLLSSHRLEEIEALGDRVLLLDRGRAAFHGDLATFTRSYVRNSIEIEFSTPSAAVNVMEVAKRTGVDASTPDPRTIRLDGLESMAAALGMISDPSSVVRIEDRTPTLLDVLERAWNQH